MGKTCSGRETSQKEPLASLPQVRYPVSSQLHVGRKLDRRGGKDLPCGACSEELFVYVFHDLRNRTVPFSLSCPAVPGRGPRLGKRTHGWSKGLGSRLAILYSLGASVWPNTNSGIYLWWRVRTLLSLLCTKNHTVWWVYRYSYR